MAGKFVISLDFELLWGVRDKKTIEGYGANIKGVHDVIPRLIKIFNEHHINATFSTVGLLFFKSKDALINNIPHEKPTYTNANLSPYNGHFDAVKNNFQEDPYHFAPQLIEQIQKSSNHEIGTHTFSHYYCLEPGQTVAQFKADLEAAIAIAHQNNIALTSLIFPRNQFNEAYLNVCAALGILAIRGNENSWIYAAKNANGESKFRRAFRLLDAYINISGHNCHSDAYIASTTPMNIAASRFLRPYSKKLSMFDSLRLQRIKSGMTHAAKTNTTYHLWWHPHNFGINQNENFAFLEKILKHFLVLEKQYSFKSYTMTQLANLIYAK